MLRRYKLFNCAATVFYIFILALIVCSGPVKYAQAAFDPVFTIEGIKVDVTADSAVSARAQALPKAQKKAFQQLLRRLLSPDQVNMLAMPDEGGVNTDFISSMVKDFEITEEQRSDVRYIGTFTYRFKGEAVREFLKSQGMAYTDVSSKPVLILPFYQMGETPVLWHDDNPWLAAWKRVPLYQGLVPIAVPIGDASDVSDIGDEQALTYDPDRLTNMMNRYHAGQTVIALAIPQENREQLTVMTYRVGQQGPEFMKKITAGTGDIGPESDMNIFDLAVQKTSQSFLDEWKTKTTVNPMEQNSLTVRVKFSSLKEWVETQKSLNNVQILQNVDLMELTPGHATLTLKFQGSERRLRLALSQKDMTLTTPSIDFAGFYDRQNDYASPLVYELYLNKYNPVQ